jgi:hypothetical protein
MSIAAIAMKHNCARSTVSGYVNQKDSAQAEGANGDAGAVSLKSDERRAGNGAREAPLEDQVRALEQLAEVEWQRLPVVERLRLLLSRGSA